jgi:DNA modification methylase
MEQKDFINKLILGDNLAVLQSIPDKSVDLIYLDPPFFSNRTYEVIWGDDGEKRSFEDRFAGGIDHYISWLKIRVRQMYRILKDTGSIFLHCDWHANAEIKVDILNKIFGRNNFKNEIIWSYKRYTAKSNKFQSLHDTIFWYSKGKECLFNDTREEYGENSGKMDSHYKQDEDGSWYRMQKRKGEEPYKIYLSEGKRVGDVWEISIINASAKERIGYPTQKPEALLQRIIECATNEGDVVLDPFVGGGTTIAVADRLKRKWIGIDQSVMAIKVSDLRMQKRENDLFNQKQPYEVILPTFDFKKLQAKDGKEFEIWIVDKFGGVPNEKGGKDGGIDGHTQYGTPIQVKKWKKPVGRDTLDAFLTAIKNDDNYLFEKNKKEGQICGFIVAFDFSKDIINAVSKLRNKEDIIIELKYIRDIIPYENPPKVTLTAEELEEWKYKFEAKTESETGIDFFSWDLSHNEEEFKADVVMDKKGIQEKKFAEGEHHIAVQAVDKKGLSGTDKVKIDVMSKKEKKKRSE